MNNDDLPFDMHPDLAGTIAIEHAELIVAECVDAGFDLIDAKGGLQDGQGVKITIEKFARKWTVGFYKQDGHIRGYLDAAK